MLLSGAAMTYSRNVAAALSFMALLGIEIGIVILSTISTRKKKEKPSPISSKTKEGRDPDRISQLPDDLLISIIKDFSTKDIVKTSILSNHWRNLYKFVPHMNFDCLNIFGTAPPPHDHRSCTCCRRLQKRFIKGVDKFFGLYSGYNHNCTCRLQKRFIKGVDKCLGASSRMISCQLTCCFTESYPNKVEEWIRSLGRLGIKQLSLTFKCSFFVFEDYRKITPEFSCQLIHEAAQSHSLQYLSLSRCTLKPNLKSSQCNYLKTLRLTNVTINSVAMECVMANCLNLESLVMKWCTLISSKLCIRHLRLKELSVRCCSPNLEEIELHAGNLTRFVYSSATLVQIYFNHVPVLESFKLQLHGDVLMQFLFGQLAKLENNQETRELSWINVFSNLRRLDLQYAILPEQLSDATVLDLCPLLQEFNLESYHATLQEKDESRVFDEEQVKKRRVNFHTNLKNVGFSGFSGATSEIKFTLYILRIAIALDQMNISCYYKYYLANSHWRSCGLPWTKDKIKSMHQLFQRYAISDSAKIILSLPRFEYILEN